MPSSRQASSNASEGGGNRESSLDDSGVVDDHEEQDIEVVNVSTAEVYFDIFYSWIEINFYVSFGYSYNEITFHYQ